MSERDCRTCNCSWCTKYPIHWYCYKKEYDNMLKTLDKTEALGIAIFGEVFKDTLAYIQIQRRRREINEMLNPKLPMLIDEMGWYIDSRKKLAEEAMKKIEEIKKAETCGSST